MASSTSPAPSSVSGSEPASVRPVACLRCRQRRSYCSKNRPQCSRCRDAGFECIYEEARKITVNESYLRLLEEKVKAYEGAPDTVTRNRTVAGPSRRTVAEDYVNDEEFEDEHPLLEPFNQLTVDRLSTSFKGPGNADNFLRSMRKLSGFYGDDGSLDLNPNFYEPGALPSRRELLAVHARLPPPDICRRLFAAQYTYIGTIFAFSDPDAFERLLLEARRRGPPDLGDKDACLSYAKVLVILAFGQLYSVNQWIDFKGPPGFEYFTHALQLLPDPHEEGSILCVETLALMGYFFQNMNRRDAAFLYIGMAMRMAISLGLHQEVSSRGGQEAELDEVSREHRRRVWWSLYSLDRILSIKSGNPVTIQDEDIGVQLPSKLPGEAEYCPAVVLRHYTVVSRILGEVTKLIYRRNTAKSGRRLMASVQKIILSLSDWNRDLPDELRFDPAKLSISRESVSTFSHYYQCINMTARPLLFHVVQKRLGKGKRAPAPADDWREGLSRTTVRVIEMCVSAAQDTINMMAVAAQRDLVATYGYMDGEHIFSAAIVLVMACAALDPDDRANTAAMDAGLDLLRGMAERGNSHMGARYELLAHLRNVIVPGGGGYGQQQQQQHQVVQQQQQQQQQPVAVAALFPSGAHVFSPVLPPGVMQSPMTASLVAAQAAMAYPTTALTPTSDGTPPLGGGLGGGRVFAVESGGGKDVEMPVFSMAHENALREPFWDESMSNGTDFGLWEEGFANPAVDAGFDLRQWTQTARMVVDGVWDEDVNA